MRTFPFLLVMLVFGACRFQDLTPPSVRRDETSAQTVAVAFYQALGTRDSTALNRIALTGATALVAGERVTAVLVTIRSLIAGSEYRVDDGPVRITRSDFRPDGDVATDRLTVVTRTPGRGSREYEATDVLTLARRSGEWRVAQAVLGTWRARSAP